MQKKKKNKSLIIGICIILMGIIIGIIPIFVKQKRTKTENIKVDDYINNTSITNNNHHDEDIINSNNNIDINDTKEKYIMVIEIPKLKLKRGIYPLGSKLNSIEYNIELLKGSIMPNADNSNLILAAHNGNSRVSYFNNLYKLKINTLFSLYSYGVATNLTETYFETHSRLILSFNDFLSCLTHGAPNNTIFSTLFLDA